MAGVTSDVSTIRLRPTQEGPLFSSAHNVPDWSLDEHCRILKTELRWPIFVRVNADLVLRFSIKKIYMMQIYFKPYSLKYPQNQ